MEFDPVLLAPRRARAVAHGHRRDCTVDDELDACPVSNPTRPR